VWKIWVVAGAVGAASLAAVVVLGRAAIEPKPLDERYVAVEDLTWVQRADGYCREAADEVRAVLSGAPGLESDEDRAVRLFRETTQVQGRLVRRLDALPLPTEDQRAAVAVLARQQARDTRTAQALAREFDIELLRTELDHYDVVARGLRERFRRLGIDGCAAYLDPATYD
jgi:hypothetical protein